MPNNSPLTFLEKVFFSNYISTLRPSSFHNNI
uniref:Uncharacterized protein n=1 Tax=Arundo donax TaxID=35708 RepID=A0A0A9A716_ARUDO